MAVVAAVVAGASCSDPGDEGAGADVDRAAVVEARLPTSSAVPAIVSDAEPVQEPVEPGQVASTDADTSSVPEVAGVFVEPAQIASSAPVSYVQQSDGLYVIDGGPLTLVQMTQGAGDAAAGLEVPGQGYMAPVGPHVEVGDSPAPAGESGASVVVQELPTEGVAPAPGHRSRVGPEVHGEMPATFR